MAAALRLLLRQRAAARTSPSPMLRSLFTAPYSKAAAAAAANLPTAPGASLPPPRMREVTPRKAPPTPKGEPRCCKTVPSTMSDSTKSLLDKLKDIEDIRKSLQDMKQNIEEHMEVARKAQHDRWASHDLLRKRLDDRRELVAKIKNKLHDFEKTRNMQDGLALLLDMQDDLAKAEKMRDDFDKDSAILDAKIRSGGEQAEMLRKEVEDYVTAVRRYSELVGSTMEEVEKLEKLKKVEKVKKVAKVGAAVGLVGGLLLILAKI